MKRLLLVVSLLVFAKEAHVSGGYAECFTDVDGVICIESDSRKRFVDDEQAQSWIGGHRQQAEQRLLTLVPRLRLAFAAARTAGLPIAVVDDWRLRTDPAAPTGAHRVQLELGTFERQIIALTFTSTRAMTEPERTALRDRLQQALSAAPSSSATTEDVQTWKPLWVADHDDVPLGIGTTMRVSPLAAQAWKPWLQQQLRALRAAWSSTPCALPKGLADDVPSRFSTIDGFRPWGPLVLGQDVQARVDDGAIVRMARLRVSSSSRAESLYGDITRCLQSAADKAPLPGPPRRSQGGTLTP